PRTLGWLATLEMVGAVAVLTRGAAAAPNPQIVNLAKAASACSFEDGAFSEDCPAYKAWSDNETLFAEGKGNDTILALLGDPDLKLRTLAAGKGFEDPKSYFADRGRAKQLFALAAKETDAEIARSLADSVTYIEAEKAGLERELRVLA